MFTVLADALFVATRKERHPLGPKKEWADRFVPSDRKKDEDAKFRFNPYRDLW